MSGNFERTQMWQPYNRMKVLQQGLLHLGLCVVIVVCLSMGSGSRINVMFRATPPPKKKTENVEISGKKHGEFCFDWSVATMELHDLRAP